MVGWDKQESVIGQLQREFDEQEQSMDDRMMAEVADDMRARKRWMSLRQECIRKNTAEQRRAERERRERESRLNKEKEAALHIERYIVLHR